MSKYRKIDVRIWNDAKFSTMSDNGKLAFLFVLTHPHMTSLGAMRATIPGMAAELGWKPEAFREAFREALTKGLAKHDEKASFVWLPNFLKYNAPESPNVVKSWEKSLELIPECDMYFELLQQVKAFTEALPKGFVEALPEDFRKSMPNPEPEQEPEEKKEGYISPTDSDFIPVVAFTRTPAVTGIEIDGQLVEYFEQPAAWEAEFIRRFNLCRGVEKRLMPLDTPLRKKLQQRLCEVDWFWKRAIEMFPLETNLNLTQNLSWFLNPATVSGILDGTYHQKPQTKGKRNDRQVSNPGQTYDPVAASLDTRPLDEV